MSQSNTRHTPPHTPCSELAALVAAIPPARRPAVLQCVASFRPCETIEKSFAVAPLRAAFAQVWESHYRRPLPVEQLRAVLDPPVPIGTVLCFSKLMLVADGAESDAALVELIRHLHHRIRELAGSPQLNRSMSLMLGGIRHRKRSQSGSRSVQEMGIITTGSILHCSLGPVPLHTCTIKMITNLESEGETECGERGLVSATCVGAEPPRASGRAVAAR